MGFLNYAQLWVDLAVSIHLAWASQQALALSVTIKEVKTSFTATPPQ